MQLLSALLPLTLLTPALANIISTPGLPGINATIDVDGDGDIDIITSLDLPGPLNVVEILYDLLDNGKIDLVDDFGCTSNTTSSALVKRANVPFLHCGFSRATRCALSTSGVLATCVWAAISLGKDIKEDSKCAASIVALASNMPNDCKLCLGVS